MTQLAALAPGTRLKNGAFAVGEVLGQGGFGITYKGGDMVGKRYVAIKEFFPLGAIRQGNFIQPSGVSSQSHAAGKDDFLREAQTLARFEDPGIVRVLGTFEENDTAYMVMELLEGQTLAARIAEKGALDEWEVSSIALRLANALAVIHGAGILHRDIKPENVMLSRSGRAVLIDFGTAREFGGAAQPMTQIVTPGYAPLEQYAAQAKSGPASDIYALGATLYHALSGQQPVSATDRAADVLLPPLRELKPQLTPVVAAAVMHALEMDVARRPASALSFIARLQGRTPPVGMNFPPASISPAAPPQTAPIAATIPDFFSSGLVVPTLPISTAPVEARIENAIAQIAPLGVATAPASVVMQHTLMERDSLAINDLQFSLDSTRLISVGSDRMVCVWNARTQLFSFQFGAHHQPITSLSLSPDGEWLATGGRDERVCIWANPVNPASRELLVCLTDCRGVVRDLAFCPTRRELLVGDEGALTLWDAGNGQIKARRDVGVSSLAWSPDGASIAFGSVLDGALHLCSGENLTSSGQIAAHQGEIAAIAFSPDGSTLATTGSDGYLRLWDVTSGALVWQQRPASTLSAALCWSPDGRLLASSSGAMVFLWTTRGELWTRYTKHRDTIQALAFAPQPLAPSRYWLASASRDKTINICRIKSAAAP